MRSTLRILTVVLFSAVRALLILLASSAFYCKPAYAFTGREHLIDAGLLPIAIIAMVCVAAGTPHRILQRLRTIRRERLLFRSMAARSRHACMVCEPVYGSTHEVTDFRILYTNRQGARLLGAKGNNAKTLRCLLPPSNYPATMSTWSRVLRSGQAATAKLSVRGTTNQVSTCEVQLVPQCGCLVVTTMHSREEQKTRREMAELHEFTRAVFDSAPVAILVADPTGTIVAMNAGAEALTLFPKQDVIQKRSVFDLVDPESIGTNRGRRAGDKQVWTMDWFVEQCTAGERVDWQWVRRDGSHVCVHLTLTPLRTERDVSGYLLVAFDVTERKQMADTAFYMAHHDALTGLPNRTLVQPTLEAALRDAQTAGRSAALFALDIDNFKRINDSLGHAAGDTVLTTVAARLLATLRPTDFAARLGGDEFVVLLPDIRSAGHAEARAKSLLESIARPFQVGQREICVSASIGYCMFPECAPEADELLRRADLAMYAAKSAGRGRCAPFTDEMQRCTQGRLEMEEELRHAIEHGELALHYQPQVTCATGTVPSVEMLLRWHSPKRGNVPPDVFLPVAQEAGLMFEIGAWSLRKACLDCVAAQTQLGRRLRVAVNLSCQQINDPKMAKLVEDALHDSGLRAEDLELEITEQMLMLATPCVLDTLDRIRKLGISLAIDDFGTGFSSFSYILQYQVDRLKIDKSFVAQASTDSHAAAIVRTVIAMAHNLGLNVCAEGAENEAEIDFLHRRRCDEIQGYFYARPVPLEALQTTIAAIEEGARKKMRGAVRRDRPVAIPFPAAVPPPAETGWPRLQA